MNILGADISYWQGVIDFAVMSRKVQFLFIRAAHGGGADSRLAYNVEQSTAYGLPFGLYFYVMPTLKPANSWSTQADLFIKLIQLYGGALPPVIDLETDGGMSKTELEGWVFKFQRKVETATGRELMIYTSAGFFNVQMPLTDWAWRMPLWVAHWDVKQPILPYEWSNHSQEWTFWQYSAKGNGIGYEYGCPGSRDLDLDQFKGDAAKFKEMFGVDPKPIEPQIPKPPPEYVTVVGENVFVRSEPVLTLASQAGRWKKGAKVKVVGEDGEFWKVETYVSKDWAK